MTCGPYPSASGREGRALARCEMGWPIAKGRKKREERGLLMLQAKRERDRGMIPSGFSIFFVHFLDLSCICLNAFEFKFGYACMKGVPPYVHKHANILSHNSTH
jgi:hypothetical protein